jgi:hypothetical protein
MDEYSIALGQVQIVWRHCLTRGDCLVQRHCLRILRQPYRSGLQFQSGLLVSERLQLRVDPAVEC